MGDGNEIYFKCKQTTPLQKLMHAYCNQQGVATNSVRFLFDGNRINETQTPAQLDMESGDVIDVMVEQQGFLPWSTAPVAVAAAGDGDGSGAPREKPLLLNHDVDDVATLHVQLRRCLRLVDAVTVEQEADRVCGDALLVAVGVH